MAAEVEHQLGEQRSPDRSGQVEHQGGELAPTLATAALQLRVASWRQRSGMAGESSQGGELAR
jgi:hypothetical protein